MPPNLVVASEVAVNERLQGLHPNPRGYTVVHRNIYNVHQRVAGRFRVNRVFLAGDSNAVKPGDAIRFTTQLENGKPVIINLEKQ